MKNYKDSIEDRIQEILNEFDFIRVHTVMTQMNWVWWGRGIPTVTALKETAEKLLRDVVEDELRYAARGGLEASLYKTKDWFDLNLKFVVTECGDDGIYYSDNTHTKHKIKIK